MMRAILILLCLSGNFAFCEPEGKICQLRHCLAIVDAGSTGSRLHIYAYNLDNNNTPFQIDKLWSKKTKPGFSNIDYENISAYLTNLFSQAPEKNIPVYFFATAGMRLETHTKQQLKYKALQEWFRTQPQWKLIDVKTISGKDEAIYGWLAMNYILGGLQSGEKPLVGLLDMGGSSVQIAVPVKKEDAIDPKDLVRLNIYGRQITLFVHSFLGIGQTQILHQFFYKDNCFPNNYPLSDETKGKGNASTCEQDISELLNLIHEVNSIVNPILTTNQGISWYTINGLESMVKNKPFDFRNQQFTSQSMLQQAEQKVCRQPWKALSRKYASNEYIHIECLLAAYYYALIVHGYGIPRNQTINYVSDKNAPDWTLGVVLQQPK